MVAGVGVEGSKRRRGKAEADESIGGACGPWLALAGRGRAAVWVWFERKRVNRWVWGPGVGVVCLLGSNKTQELKEAIDRSKSWRADYFEKTLADELARVCC